MPRFACLGGNFIRENEKVDFDQGWAAGRDGRGRDPIKLSRPGTGRDGDPNLNFSKGRDGTGTQIERDGRDAETLASPRPSRNFFSEISVFFCKLKHLSTNNRGMIVQTAISMIALLLNLLSVTGIRRRKFYPYRGMNFQLLS